MHSLKKPEQTERFAVVHGLNASPSLRGQTNAATSGKLPGVNTFECAAVASAEKASEQRWTKIECKIEDIIHKLELIERAISWGKFPQVTAGTTHCG